MNLNDDKFLAHVNNKFVCFRNDRVVSIALRAIVNPQAIILCTTESGAVIQKRVFLEEIPN